MKSDIFPSFVVFLVALPLCLGIAIASGAPPALGIISGIVGGIVVGLLAGSPLQVSGPAAGLTVLVFDFVQRYGIEPLGVAVLFAGSLQLALGVAKMGRWFRAVSPAVIEGMLAGIGILIFASQFHGMLDAKPTSSGLHNLLSIPHTLFDRLWPWVPNQHTYAAGVGTLTVVVVVAWNFIRRNRSWLRSVPGALVGIVVATASANLLFLPIDYVKIPASLWAATNIPTAESWALLLRQDMWVSILGIALIASAETLLCATAVDQLHQGPRTNYDKELGAQGIGNIVCGLLGALPLTGVIVRSSANVEAGAKTRWSAILHGIWLVALIVFAPAALELIPRSALAGILVYTGAKLVRIYAIKQLGKAGKGELVVYGATIVGIVTTNLLTGVLIGFFLSALKLLLLFARLDIVVFNDKEENRMDISLEGSATFVRLPDLADALEAVPRGTDVHIHVGGLAYIDHACIELLDSWQTRHIKRGGMAFTEWDELHARSKRQRVFSPLIEDPARFQTKDSDLNALMRDRTGDSTPPDSDLP